MKKVNLFSVLSLMLTVLAVAFGGGAMAVSSMSYGGDADDPNADTPLEGALKNVPADKGGIAQHGQMASGDKLQEAGLIDNKLRERVLEYHAQRYPFYTAVFNKATQFAFQGHKEAEYPEVGDIKTEAKVKSNITGGTEEVTITNQLHADDMSIFRPNYTIFVLGQTGYDEAGNANNETLELYVVSNDSNGIKVRAINGSISNSKVVVPNISAGKVFKLGAPALAEEEVEVDPINTIPEMKKTYLQKKGYSVAITDFFNESVKEIDWEQDKIKRQALDAYKKLYTTTALFGSKKKFYKRNKNGVRTVYTQDGLLNQIRMAYQLNAGAWTKADLIAISKMLFTAYTDATEVDVFCGSDAIESLLNIDWGSDVSRLTYLKDEDYKIKIASFESTFGTLKFVHEMSLTENHLEKAAIAVPMRDCMRVWRDNGSTKKVDGNKGETGAVEELTKEYFLQDDTFICNAMNTMLIGPASLFTGGNTGNIKKNIISTPKISEFLYSDVNDGDVFYLTTPDKIQNDEYPRGLWQATVDGTTLTWSAYKQDWEA